VAHSRRLWGVHHEENSSKIPYITIWQHWLGNTKPKKSFQIDPKRFQKVATEFKKYIILQNFLLTD